MERNTLIAGITDQAKAEAEAIIKETEHFVTERKAAIDSQIKTLLDQAGIQAEKQIKIIESTRDTRISVANRKKELQMRDSVVRNVLDRAKKQFLASNPTDTVRETLHAWIVEGALALNNQEVYINTSDRDSTIVREELPKVEATVKSLTGRKVTLKLSSEPPITGFGVMLTSADGAVAFDNRLETRFLRYQSQILRHIHEGLFSEK